MKQTAVEWLGFQLNMLFTDITEEQWDKTEKLFQQAKAMEKEQMFSYTKEKQVIGENSMKFFKEDFEQYYNKTYKR